MPTVLLIDGWRFFIYPNEGNEPFHIHVEKAEKEAKFWLDSVKFTAEPAVTYNMNSKDIRQVKRIIFEYFEVFEEAWKDIHGNRS